MTLFNLRGKIALLKSNFKIWEDKVYLALLLVIVFAVGYADVMLLSNFKASVLLAIGTSLVLFLNYRFSITAIGNMAIKYHAKIFTNWKWYRDEWGITYKSFLSAAGFILVIMVFWYWPRNYSINWPGLIIALIIVPFVSIVAGILGTKRGLQKHMA